MAKKKKDRIGPSAEEIQGPSGKKPEKQVITRPSPEDVEREVRRYVKRSGGFKKDLPEADRKRCEELCKKYNRPAEWTTALPM